MIRKLDKSHKKELNLLIREAFLENIFITKKNNHSFFGYFENDQLLGIVGYFSMKRFKVLGFINAFVKKEYRNRGIYSQLAKERYEYCVEHYKGFTVFSTANNNSMPELTKLGFEILGTQYRMCKLLK
jgi:GNAT superfamily N-acetyltransferase